MNTIEKKTKKKRNNDKIDSIQGNILIKPCSSEISLIRKGFSILKFRADIKSSHCS